MKKILFAYQFAILGGVATQLVNRARVLSKYAEVHFMFLSDLGGVSTFNEFGNVHIVTNYHEFESLLSHNDFYAISVIDTKIVHLWLEAYNYKGHILNETHTTYPQHLESVLELKKYRIDKFLVPSQYMKEQLVNLYSFLDQEVEVLSNCVDTAFFTKVESRKISQPIVMWIGKLDDHKNWKGFLEIVRELQKNTQEFLFFILGGYTAQADTIDALYKEILSLRYPENVKWLPYVEYEKMPHIYSLVKNSGGVCVSTSKNESFGMTVVEAMSVGLTPVSTCVGALPELYSKINQDLLYPFFNVGEASRIILENINVERTFNVEPYSTNYFADSFCRLIDL